MSVPDIPWDILALAMLLLFNRLMVQVLHRRPSLYWGIQSTNSVMALLVVGYGIPSVPDFAIVKWLVGGLLVFHVMQNASLRQHLRMQSRQDSALKSFIQKRGDEVAG